ncbi:MAG: hypothetical protein ACYCOS_06785 [Sulfobacillus sp.]
MSEWTRRIMEHANQRQAALAAQRAPKPTTNALGERYFTDAALAALPGPMTVQQTLRDVDRMAKATGSPEVCVLTGWCAEAGIELDSALAALAQCRRLQGDYVAAYFGSIGISDMKLASELWTNAHEYGLRQAVVWQDVILWGTYFGALGPGVEIKTVWALVHHCAATQLPLDVELSALAQRMDEDDTETVWDIVAIAFGCTGRNLMGRLSNYAALSGQPLSNLLVQIEENAMVKRLSAGEYAETVLQESQRKTAAEPGSSRQGGNC